MSVKTLMLDFAFEEVCLIDEMGQKSVFNKIETILKDYITNLLLVSEVKIDGGSLKLLTGKKGSTVTIRLYDRGFISINIEYFQEAYEDPLMSFDALREVEVKLLKYISAEKSQAYAPIKRMLFCRYYPTADERLLEYDVDKLLFEKQSEFQKVQIVHSKSLGNMLVLDELQNIAEADIIYTDTIMQKGKESYEGAEIVILGGGDGALLFELLKENPKFVWLLEIDDVVIQACNTHLKSLCGEVLEQTKTDKYEIIVDDCMATVKKLIAQGKKVDYVFGDLTDIPISDSPTGQMWEFIMLMLESSMKILKPTGKFMTQGHSANCPEPLVMYEEQLAKLKPRVEFTKTKAFIPSFYEDWVFYQISLANEENGDA